MENLDYALDMELSYNLSFSYEIKDIFDDLINDKFGLTYDTSAQVYKTVDGRIITHPMLYDPCARLKYICRHCYSTLIQ